MTFVDNEDHGSQSCQKQHLNKKHQQQQHHQQQHQHQQQQQQRQQQQQQPIEQTQHHEQEQQQQRVEQSQQDFRSSTIDFLPSSMHFDDRNDDSNTSAQYLQGVQTFRRINSRSTPGGRTVKSRASIPHPKKSWRNETRATSRSHHRSSIRSDSGLGARFRHASGSRRSSARSSIGRSGEFKPKIRSFLSGGFDLDLGRTANYACSNHSYDPTSDVESGHFKGSCYRSRRSVTHRRLSKESVHPQQEIDEGEDGVLDFDRHVVRMESLEVYILVSTLTAIAAFTIIDNMKPQQDSVERMCLYYVNMFLASASALSGLYAAVVFSLCVLYGKTALGMSRDTMYLLFIQRTAKYRVRGFRAFSASLLCFSIMIVLLVYYKIPNLYPRIICSLAVFFFTTYIFDDWRCIMNIATPIFTNVLPDEFLDETKMSDFGNASDSSEVMKQIPSFALESHIEGDNEDSSIERENEISSRGGLSISNKFTKASHGSLSQSVTTVEETETTISNDERNTDRLVLRLQSV